MVVQLIQNLVSRPSKTIWMDLNVSTACYQHCSNGITMCVQNQWAFLKVEILNGFKWSISRRVKGTISSWSTGHGIWVLVFILTQWLKIIPHIRRLPLLLHKWASNCVHFKLGHRFHAMLQVCSDRDNTVSLIGRLLVLVRFDSRVQYPVPFYPNPLFKI